MRSPFTGVLFALELTHQFEAILPLIIGATSAFAVSVLLLKRSVLTEKIVRRGYHLTREYDVDPLAIMFVGEVMDEDIVEFERNVSVAEALAVVGLAANDVAAWRQRLYPVVDPAGQLAGVVSRAALLTAELKDSSVLISELMETDPVITHADQPLRHVAEVMATTETYRLPVVDRDNDRQVIGLVTLPQLLIGRRRDQMEARERERILRVRLVRPRWTSRT